MPFESGDTFDRYTIETLLGEGGMGKVYRAFDPRLQRRVALKVLRTDIAADGEQTTEARARMMREARAAAALEHANCVAIFDVGEVEGTAFIAMEYIDGASLRRFIGDAGVPLGQKIAWLIDIGRALRAAHRRGLVHRDIKPENVMVREDGTVKVLDFGIAKRALADDADAETTEALEGPQLEQAITRAGAVSGTPQYMAPEQIRGGVLDGRVDQFAWGVVAYELLTGHHPWREGREGNQVLVAMVHDPPLPPSCYVPSLPALVQATVLKSLAKSPADRFGSMDGIVTALEPYAAGAQRALAPSGTQGEIESVKTELAMPVEVLDRDPPPTDAAARRVFATLAAAAISVAAIGSAIHFSIGPSPPKASADDAATPTGIAITAAEMPTSASTEALAAYHEGLQSFRAASFEAARGAFARATKLDPALSAAHLRLALLASLVANEREAREAFQRAVQYRASLPARDQALVDAMEPYLQREPSDLAECEARLKEATQRFPRDAELRLYLGTVQFDAGDVKAAAATFEAALDLDPDFAEAWSYRGATLAFLGDFGAALPALDRCLTVSVGATDCLWYRILIHEQQGACGLVEADARTWTAKNPVDPYAYQALAKALFARGHDENTVRTALEQRWAHLEPSLARGERMADEAHLEVAAGSFEDAAAHLAEFDKLMGGEPSAALHARVAMLRIDLNDEMGRPNESARIAADFMKRRDAWVPPAHVDDVAISTDLQPQMLAALARGGVISSAAFEERRAEWARTWTAKVSPTYLGFIWLYGYAATTSTRADAETALAALPKYLPLPSFHAATLSPDINLGRTYALVERDTDAVGALEHASQSCVAFDDPLKQVQAQQLLGVVHERRGERVLACDAYRFVLERWGNAKPSSVTANAAREGLRRADCDPRDPHDRRDRRDHEK